MRAVSDHPVTATPEYDRWSHRVWREGAVSVLVVSEAIVWRHEVRTLLEADSYAVRLDDGGDAMSDLGCPFDVAVVDLALTSRSPLSVFSALRGQSPLPILAIAPERPGDVSAISALEAGADQVLHRSGRSDELLARIRALLRQSPPRTRLITAAAARRVPSIRLDVGAGVVTVAARPVPLARGEVELLHALLVRPGRVVPREELAAPSHGRPADGSLDALVRGLRTKLEAVEGWRRIVTIRGVGFRLVPDGEAADRPPARS